MAQTHRVVTCAVCSKAFAAARPNAKYCSGACREKARYRRSTGGGAEVVQLDPPKGLTYAQRFIESVRKKLEDAGRGDEPLSLLALSLAEDAVNAAHPPAARKQFTAEFRATFAEAMRGVASNSRVDELRRRREALRADAG